jgi:hypothetical protein
VEQRLQSEDRWLAASEAHDSPLERMARDAVQEDHRAGRTEPFPDDTPTTTGEVGSETQRSGKLLSGLRSRFRSAPKQPFDNGGATRSARAAILQLSIQSYPSIPCA